MCNNNLLFVHRMLERILSFNRHECSRAHMKRDVCGSNVFLLKAMENFVRKMKTSSWRSNSTFMGSIHGLISIFIAGICIAFQVWRQGSLSNPFDDLSESVVARPRKPHNRITTIDEFGTNDFVVMTELQCCVFSPSAHIANCALPRGRPTRKHGLLYKRRRLNGIEEEYFNCCAG